MEIVLDSAQIESGEFLTGALVDRHTAETVVALMRRTGSPFGVQIDEVRSFLVEGDKFAIVGPGIPISGNGPLLPVEWWVEARSGSDVTSTPIVVTAGALTVEPTVEIESDQRSESANLAGLLLAVVGAVVGLIGIATAFGTGSDLVRVLSGAGVVIAWLPLAERLLDSRNRSAIGDTNVRVESHHEGFDCTVSVIPRAGATDADRPRAISVSAMLIVAEMASKSHVGRGPTAHEEVIGSVPIPLDAQPDHTWVGSVASEALEGLPMSNRDKRGSTSWVVKVTTSAAGAKDDVRQVPLLVYPVDLPESQRPTSVEIPEASK